MATSLTPLNNTIRIVLIIIAACALNIATMWLARWAGGIDTEALVQATVDLAFAGRGVAPRGDEAARAASIMGPMLRLYPLMAIITTVFSMLLMTTIFYLAFRFLDGAPKWTVVFGAVAVAALCQAGAGFLLTGAAVASQPPTAAEVLSGSFVATNAVGILPENSPLLLVTFIRRFDVLTLVFLIVLGVALAERVAPKISPAAVGGVIAACFALWISGALMLAAVVPSVVAR